MVDYEKVGDGQSTSGPGRGGLHNDEKRYKSLTSAAKVLRNYMSRFDLEFGNEVNLAAQFNGIVDEASKLKGKRTINKSIVDDFDRVYGEFLGLIEKYKKCTATKAKTEAPAEIESDIDMSADTAVGVSAITEVAAVPESVETEVPAVELKEVAQPDGAIQVNVAPAKRPNIFVKIYRYATYDPNKDPKRSGK